MWLYTYAWDIGVPVVEGQEVLHQASHDGHLFLGVVVDDLLGQLGLVDTVAISAQLLVHKALLGRGERARGDGIVVGGERLIEFDVVAGHRVVWVVHDRIVILGRAAYRSLRRIGDVVGVAEWAIVDGVTQTSNGLATEKVVHRTVLQFEDDHILDVIL